MTRLPYLDNLRSVALLLGLVFHSAIVYGADIGYAIQNQERSSALGLFCYFIHSFRMPLFFCISGFFTGLVWERKGMRAYLESRWNRILLPTLFGILCLAPIQYFLMQKEKDQSIDFLSFYVEFWQPSQFALSHLWFLVYLVFYSVLWMTLAPLTKKLFSRLQSFKLSHSSFLILSVLFTFSSTWIANQIFRKGIPILGIEPLLFIYQAVFFFLGVFAYYSKQVFVLRASTKKETQLLTFLLLPSFLAFLILEKTDPMWKAYHWVDPFLRTGHLFLWAGLPWLWIPLFVGLFQKFFNQTSNAWAYLSRASLAIYLIHHPISLWIASILVPWNSHVLTKFILHSLAVFILSFAIYEFGIKRIYFFRILTGTKETT